MDAFDSILRFQLDLWNKLTSDNYFFDDVEDILD